MKSEFKKLLWRWLSCPNLAKPPGGAPASTQTAQRQDPPGRKPCCWPVPRGRAPEIGDGRKVTIHSARNSFAVSFRVADLGLLVEFSLWVAGFGFRITSDHLSACSWLRRERSDP
jgi:hypothetical protein